MWAVADFSSASAMAVLDSASFILTSSSLVCDVTRIFTRSSRLSNLREKNFPSTSNSLTDAGAPRMMAAADQKSWPLLTPTSKDVFGATEFVSPSKRLRRISRTTLLLPSGLDGSAGAECLPSGSNQRHNGPHGRSLVWCRKRGYRDGGERPCARALYRGLLKNDLFHGVPSRCLASSWLALSRRVRRTAGPVASCASPESRTACTQSDGPSCVS